MNIRVTMLFAASATTLLGTASAGAHGIGYGIWPPDFPTLITTRSQAARCAKVALACKDCKTVTEKTCKRGIASLFKAPSTHGCSGCKGMITFTQRVSGKGMTTGDYSHMCSKCGPKSTFTSAGRKN
jgi:hypothetical protein